jgi:hypothetical protein
MNGAGEKRVEPDFVPRKKGSCMVSFVYYDISDGKWSNRNLP